LTWPLSVIGQTEPTWTLYTLEVALEQPV
jgi:hypothetical protein